MTRKEIIRIIKQIQRRSKRFSLKVKNKWRLPVTLLVAGLGQMAIVAIINSLGSLFQQLVPDSNENWAIAMIAFPIALFGVYLSILTTKMQKYSGYFAGVPLKTIYGRQMHLIDLEGSFWTRIVADFAIWILVYLASDYASMIAFSLAMVLEFLGLIAIGLWKIALSPTKIYIDNVIRQYLAKYCDYKKEQSTYSEIKEFIEKDEFEKISEYLKQEYWDFWRELSNLSLSTINKPDSQGEKTAILEVSQKIKNLQFKDINVFIFFLYFEMMVELYNISLETGDYSFASLLATDIAHMFLQKFGAYLDEISAYLDNIRKIRKNLKLLKPKEIVDLSTTVGCTQERYLVLQKIFYWFNIEIANVLSKAEEDKALKGLGDDKSTRSQYLEVSKRVSYRLERINKTITDIKEITTIIREVVS